MGHIGGDLTVSDGHVPDTHPASKVSAFYLKFSDSILCLPVIVLYISLSSNRFVSARTRNELYSYPRLFILHLFSHFAFASPVNESRGV